VRGNYLNFLPLPHDTCPFPPFLFSFLFFTAPLSVQYFFYPYRKPAMNSPRKHFLLGTGAALASVAIWGAMPVCLRYLKDFISSPWTMNFYRYGFAGSMYLVVLACYRQKGKLSWALYRKSLFPTAVNIGGQILWAMLPYYMESSLIGIYIRSSLIFGIIYSFFFFEDERRLIRKPLFWVGTLVTLGSFLGMSLSTLKSGAGAGLTALAMVTVCSMIWGLYPVAVKHSMKDVDPKLAFGLICSNTALVLIIAGALRGNPSEIITLDALKLTVLFGSAFFGIATAHLIYYYAIRTIGVVRAGNINMITPFYTILLAWVFLTEAVTPAKILYGSGIVLGVLIAGMVKQPSQPAVERVEGRE
jgi:drug/metabolite transporter (DMT)-like permease